MVTPKWIPIFAMVVCLLLNVPTTSAQNVCDVGNDNINIQFPENDPSKVISSSDVNFIQRLFVGIPETVEISESYDDQNPRIQFKNKFKVLNGTNILGHSGTFIQMFEGIDRDGKNSGIEDDVNVLTFMLRCVPQAGASAVFKTLRIQIIDINDNSPMFRHSQRAVNVHESIHVGTPLLHAHAVDKDIGVNKEVRYMLSKAVGAQFDGSDYFTIESAQVGTIKVSKRLDFESMYRATNNSKKDVVYKMIVTAVDGGRPAMSSTMLLHIYVTDSDDQGPTFDYPSCISSEQSSLKPCIRPQYTSSIKSDELSEPGTLVLLPHPVDPNSPKAPVEMIMYDMDTLDSPVTCSIANTLPRGYKSYFQAKAQQVGSSKRYRCTITQTRRISRSDVSLLQLIIEAEETSGRTDHAAVSVVVN